MRSEPLTICIPRVSSCVSQEYIIHTIDKMHIGRVESIQEIPLYNNVAFKRIIIRIKWDASSPQAQWIYNTLSENKSIKIVHSMPWYWICVKYAKQIPPRASGVLDPSLAKLAKSL
jgi:hypothetical protein